MSRGVVAQVRDIMPIRPLTRLEAQQLAERQASQFLALRGITEGPVPEDCIAELPRLHVVRRQPWPTSGATHWMNGRWVIVLNASEAAVRQRFSLAHELKHILDHRFIDVLYQRVDPEIRDQFIEQTCDYFAGCLLMPRGWIKKACLSGGSQQPRALARRFHVSEAAMRVRLSQLGMTKPKPRCARPTKDWAVRAITEGRDDPLYERATRTNPAPESQT